MFCQFLPAGEDLNEMEVVEPSSSGVPCAVMLWSGSIVKAVIRSGCTWRYRPSSSAQGNTFLPVSTQQHSAINKSKRTHLGYSGATGWPLLARSYAAASETWRKRHLMRYQRTQFDLGAQILFDPLDEPVQSRRNSPTRSFPPRTPRIAATPHSEKCCRVLFQRNDDRSSHDQETA